MALYGPSIPAALLHAGDSAQLVHPASDQWWHNLQQLRLASQTSRLSCPDCGQRLVFVCEKVPTPYFRHYRDEADCVEEQGGTAERRAQGWLRHQLVVAFRRALPPGTSLECDEYLANRSPSMTVGLPQGARLVLELISESQELAPFLARQAECRAARTPLLTVFVGRRIPAAVAEAARLLGHGGMAAVTVTGLNADHDAAARAYRVDMAHAAADGFYGLPLLAGAPRTLLFFAAAPHREADSHLLLLRGLLPNPALTAWHGRVIKVAMAPGQLGASLRHGLYTAEDVTVLQQMRRLFGRQRRGIKRAGQGSYVHPLTRRWEAKRSLLEAEQARRAAEEAEAHRRVEDVRRQVAEHQAREEEALRRARAAEEERRQRAAQRRQQARSTIARLLVAEGTALLGEEPVPVPYPQPFAASPWVWQAAFLGFAYRAGLPFTTDDCLNWLRGDFPWVLEEKLLPKESWQATQSVRVFLTGAEERGLLARVDRLYHPGQWPWPTRERTPGTAAFCLLCGEETEHWFDYDPASGYCRCTRHGNG